MPNDPISGVHQSAKKDSYWENLTDGNTSQYKESSMNQLLNEFAKFPVKQILDIGCGTCELAFQYKDRFKADTVTCLDYDQKVIERLKTQYGAHSANWLCADVFQIKKSNLEKFDLILLLDVVHEIYSFYGRKNKSLTESVEHEMGQRFVRELLDNVTSLVQKNGMIIITDNILCEYDDIVTVKLKNEAAKESVLYFF